MAAAVHKMLMWLDGSGWVTPFQISEAPEGNADPDGSVSVPVIPGTQRMNVDGQWVYLIPPANLATLIQAGSQIPANQSTTNPSTSVSVNPMAMMQQMIQQSMLVQMMQSIGLNMGPSQEPKQPIDLSQLSGPAAIFGEKIKDTVITALQMWRAVKG